MREPESEAGRGGIELHRARERQHRVVGPAPFEQGLPEKTERLPIANQRHRGREIGPSAVGLRDAPGAAQERDRFIRTSLEEVEHREPLGPLRRIRLLLHIAPQGRLGLDVAPAEQRDAAEVEVARKGAYVGLSATAWREMLLLRLAQPLRVSAMVHQGHAEVVVAA